MKITNKTGLPEPIVNAVKNDRYSRGNADISVTTLIGPPRKAALEEKHQDEITEDASDRIWSLLGQSVHTILERANQTPCFVDRMFYESEGWKISGQMDLYDDKGVITDYKITSMWAVKGGAKEEWTHQLNVYAEILQSKSIAVKGLQIVALLRDWSESKVQYNKDLPQYQVVTIPIDLWTREQAQKYIAHRVKLHQQARLELPECTAKERWERPSVYAVMKVGRKSAVKLFDRDAEAQTLAASAKDLSVVHRPGESIRCQSYCSVSKFCEQAKKYGNQKIDDSYSSS